MSKVILVMNDPKFCSNCPLAKSRKHIITRKEHWLCGIGHNGEYGDWVYEPIDMESEIRPDWCPLKPVPEKYDVLAAIENNPNYDPSYDIGRNDCIDEIIGN